MFKRNDRVSARSLRSRDQKEKEYVIFRDIIIIIVFLGSFLCDIVDRWECKGIVIVLQFILIIFSKDIKVL